MSSSLGFAYAFAARSPAAAESLLRLGQQAKRVGGRLPAQGKHRRVAAVNHRVEFFKHREACSSAPAHFESEFFYRHRPRESWPGVVMMMCLVFNGT